MVTSKNEIHLDIGDVVYLKTDEMQQPYLVRGIIIRSTGVLYELSQSSFVSEHYIFEISKQRNL